MVVSACDEEAVSHQKSSNHRCEVLAPLRDFWKGEAKGDYAANRVCSLREQRFAIPDAVAKQRTATSPTMRQNQETAIKTERGYQGQQSKQPSDCFFVPLSACWFVDSLHPIFVRQNVLAGCQIMRRPYREATLLGPDWLACLFSTSFLHSAVPNADSCACPKTEVHKKARWNGKGFGRCTERCGTDASLTFPGAQVDHDALVGRHLEDAWLFIRSSQPARSGIELKYGGAKEAATLGLGREWFARLLLYVARPVHQRAQPVLRHSPNRVGRGSRSPMPTHCFGRSLFLSAERVT
jgi:hypothetical protein